MKLVFATDSVFPEVGLIEPSPYFYDMSYLLLHLSPNFYQILSPLLRIPYSEPGATQDSWYISG